MSSKYSSSNLQQTQVLSQCQHWRLLKLLSVYSGGRLHIWNLYLDEFPSSNIRNCHNSTEFPTYCLVTRIEKSVFRAYVYNETSTLQAKMNLLWTKFWLCSKATRNLWIGSLQLPSSPDFKKETNWKALPKRSFGSKRRSHSVPSGHTQKDVWKAGPLTERTIRSWKCGTERSFVETLRWVES